MLDLSCVDWEDRIRTGRSLIPDGARGINPIREAKAIGAFNKLRLPDVPGTPTLAEACGDWFREIVGIFLGSVYEETSTRAIRELFAMVPKKQSKTSYGAGLMLAAQLLNERPRAEFLFVAPSKAIADLAFSQAVGMTELDPYLKRRFQNPQHHIKTLVDRKFKSKLVVKAFSTSILTGVKPAGVLIDELHEIARDKMAAKIIGQLRGGILPNPEGFLAFITTQSDDTPSGVFAAELLTARAIRDGKQQGVMMPVLYEFPKDIGADKKKPPKWQNPQVWPMVLPNLGRPLTIGRLIEDFDTAKGKGEAEVRRWASQHLNIEIGVGITADSWVGADFWEQCADPELTLDAIIERCDVVTVGIDGGGMDDLLGLAVLGRDRDTGDWLFWGHAWCHKTVLDRRQDIAARLLDFEADGDLTIIENVGQDVIEVATIVARLEDAGVLPNEEIDGGKKLPAIGVDRIGIVEINDELTMPSDDSREPIDQERIGGVPQGYQLNGIILTMERKLGVVTSKVPVRPRFRHCGARLMDWQVSNAKTELKGGARLITKAISGSAKIDVVMALLDAAYVMTLNPPAGKSVFEKIAEERAKAPKEEKQDGDELGKPAHKRPQAPFERFSDEDDDEGMASRRDRIHI